MSFSDFGVMGFSISLVVITSLQILEEFEKCSIDSSVNVSQNSPVKPFSPGFFLCWEFLITNHIYLLIIGLCRFSISY